MTTEAEGARISTANWLLVAALVVSLYFNATQTRPSPPCGPTEVAYFDQGEWQCGSLSVAKEKTR